MKRFFILLVSVLFLSAIYSADKFDALLGDLREADTASSLPATTTILNQLQQSVSANSFLANNGAIASYQANLPADATDGQTVEILNTASTYWYGLSALYHVDNAATDSSGNSHTATLAGGATYSDANKKLGTYALSLDGDGDWASLGTYNPFPAGTGTFNCWAKLTGTNYTAPASIDMLFAKGADNDNLNITFSIEKVSATEINLVVAYHHATESSIIINVTSFDASQYHMYTLAMGNNEQKLYIDGVLKGTGTKTSFAPQADLQLYLGAQNRDDPYKYALAGYMDEISFHTQQLSQVEIYDLYNAGAGLLVAQYYITVNPADDERIAPLTNTDGDSVLLPSKGDYLKLRSDGAGKWWVIGKQGTPVDNN